MPSSAQAPPAGSQQQQQQQQPTLKLPKEIADHYARHGVESVEEYLVGADDGSTTATCRFVRLNPRYDKEETLSLLRKEVAACPCTSTANNDAAVNNNNSTRNPSSSPFPLAVPWLNDRLGFYALPAEFGLARSECFQTGRVYGMDISSGAAVAALLYDDHDVKNQQKSKKRDIAVDQEEKEVNDEDAAGLRVLDLCCSPGLKLCAISDLLSSDSTVVGVDISESRISLCKKIIIKYQINRQTSGSCTTSTSTGSAKDKDDENRARIRLYCQDGTQFGLASFRDPDKLVFDSDIAREDEHVVAGKRKRMNKSARARQQKRLRTVAHLDFMDSATQKDGREVGGDQGAEEEQSICTHLFDRVLVDAECSTDGAIKHLKHKLKQEQGNADGNDTQAASALSKSGISKLGDEGAMADLVDLQQRLIASGFRLLKRGGTLVYSTCSLSEEQNEGVVNWLLQQRSDAYIIPVSFDASSDGNGDTKKENFLISEGTIAGTVRFRPKLHYPSNKGDNGSNSCSEDALLYGGGFWLAKLGKR